MDVDIKSFTNEELYKAFYEELRKKEFAEHLLKLVIDEIELRKTKAQVSSPNS